MPETYFKNTTGGKREISYATGRLLEETDRFINSSKSILQAAAAMDCEVSENAPFVISFVGRFKTGKSSLLNALIGAELLPTKATTATTMVTRIVRGDTFGTLLYEGGNYTRISFEEAKRLILDYEPQDPDDPAEIIFEVPIPWLPPYVELKDTPGTSDNPLLEKLAEAALADTDLCVCVYDSAAIFSEAERETTLKLHRRFGGNIVYAVNRTNLLNSIEGLKLVEGLAGDFFSSMDYGFEDMGKYYLMCSAPGMVDLDGFDVWIKKLISRSNLSLLNKLRHEAARGALIEAGEAASLKAEAYGARLIEAKKALVKKHDNIIADKRKKSKERAEQKVYKIYSDINTAEKQFSNLDGLESRLNELLEGDDWQSKYSAKSKEATKQYFYSKFASMRKSLSSANAIANNKFIDKVFSVLTFPDPKFTPIKASGGDVAGGAAAGAAIGSLFCVGIGTAIGAVIGALIGGTDSGTSNDSVVNTMSYVQNNVVLLLREAYQASAKEAAKNIERSVADNAGDLNSGLEYEINTVSRKYEALNGLLTYITRQRVNF